MGLSSHVDEYPASEKNALSERIRSKKDKDFNSATFELFLHAALSRLGFKLEPHPRLDNGSNARPDFLVTTMDGSQFYLEAVLASEPTEALTERDPIKNSVFDALAAVSHPNFMIEIAHRGHPTTQPSGKKLAKQVTSWLDTLNPDEVQLEINSKELSTVPVYRWRHEKWSIRIHPIPLKVDRRGKSQTLIGIRSAGAAFVDAWTPITNKVKSKGTKYGTLKLPLLIAVNSDALGLERIDEMQALFGQEQIVEVVGQPTQEPRMERLANGAWHGPHGPQCTRVCGVWIFSNLNPYTAAVTRNTIYLNPWAKPYPLPAELLILPHAKVEERTVTWVEGKSLREIFGFHDKWPSIG